MEQRRHSPVGDAPEAVPTQARNTFGYVGSDDYEYFEPPQSAAFERQRSPVPEYQPYDASSTRISAQSPPPPSSEIGRSPQLSDSGFTKSRPLSPSVQYSEIHSPDPQAVYNQGEKEAVYTQAQHQSKVPSYYAAPAPGIYHQNSGDRPQVWSDTPQQSQHEEPKKKKKVYKRWWFWLIVLALVAIIAVAAACGAVFGSKKSNKGSNTDPSQPTPSNPADNAGDGLRDGADPNTSVGGYLSDAFYSSSGAWNGSGIAIAAANPEVDQSIYAFYQDSAGALQYTLRGASGAWKLLGPVNADSPKALNGTPLSTVQHTIGDELRWHLFYVDADYYIRERIMTNKSTDGLSEGWSDGPLNDRKVKTWKSDSVGMQACYWGNYYGEWSYNTSQINAGIHLWYASSATVFQQLDWTNGTDDWIPEGQFNDVSGIGGVGCQTWYGMTEYVWFVNTKNELQMYWQDNNRTATPTDAHPIGEWTQVGLDIKNVQINSGLGYTNYMVWQDQDTSIHGANITFLAEDTTIADDGKDQWTLSKGAEAVSALRGTHLSLTALRTTSGGSEMLVFFQEEGDDMRMYSRDGFTRDGLWTDAPQDPVTPTPP